MTIKEYCELAGVSKSAVSYRISNNMLLPGVKEYKKEDRVFILVRDKAISTDIIKKSFRLH
jgi:hypothetical protein